MSSTIQEVIGNGNQGGDALFLSGELGIHPKPKPLYRVEVTAPAVVCTPLGETGELEPSKALVIDFKDIIGCDCLKGKAVTDTNGYLALYSYPKRRKLASKKTVRRREVVTLTFSHYDTYENNIQEAARWKTVMIAAIQRLTENIQDTTQLLPRPPKKLLVLINPFSGPGKALQIFQERVVPMFAEAGLHFNMVVTERAGHAREIARNMKLDAWHAVVIVSGDGLIFEVINGLMSRPDWERARMMPIGALPGGSGNALCCTLNHHAGESFLDNMVLHSTYVLTKHEVRPMDLVAVDTCRRRVYSFLSITWGLIADVDIESEKYRSLGNARFTVGAIARILGLRIYHGRLSFLPIEEYHPRANRSGPTRSRSVSNGFHEHAQPRAVRSQSMIVVPDNRSQGSDTPDEPPMNGFGQNGMMTADAGSIQSPQDLERVYPWSGVQPGMNGESGTQEGGVPTEQGGGLRRGASQESDGIHLNVSALEQVVASANGGVSNSAPQTAPSVQQANGNTGERVNRSTSANTVPTELLPPLDEPIPDDWVTIEDDFISVGAVFQSHLSSDLLAAPESKLDDGLIYLTFIRAPMSRGRLVQLMLSMENGSYLQHEGQEMVRVKAFRLEPLESKGTISVDGEVVDYGAIQAQVLPSMARVLAKKP